jgi:hypothetical protein
MFFCIIRAVALSALLFVTTAQPASAVRRLQIKKVTITLIKTKPDDDGTTLYFKIDNNTGSEIDVATFECNIFDSSSVFYEIISPTVRRVKNGEERVC